MAKVFISYSRKDTEFAKKLTGELQKSDYDFWIDWEGIPPTVDWWREIEKGIEEADVFLFIISPDSARSKICGQEIDTAVKNGKRIIPIVTREIEWEDTPPQLGHLNYIFFSREDNFDKATAKLLTAIQTDYEWAATHRRLQVKALEWERSNKENSFLLRGKDLQDAEGQLATNTSKEPHPTDLQREHIHKSRQVADRQRRITTGISIAGIIALAGLAIYGFVQAELAVNAQATAEANLFVAQTAQVQSDNNAATALANKEIADQQTTIARAGELAGLALSEKDKHFDIAMLFGLEGYYANNNSRTLSTLFTLTDANPELETYLSGHNDGVSSVAFSPDGKIIASGSEDNTIILWNVIDRDAPILLTTLSGHSDSVTSIAFNPEGNILASGSKDTTAILWDVSNPETPTQIATIRGHNFPVFSVAFSPDGKTLATGSQDFTIILWNISDPAVSSQITTLRHDYGVLSLTFSPDGRTLASGSGDQTIILWDVSDINNSSQITTLFWQSKGFVNSVVFSPDGKRLASGSNDGSVTLWDISDMNNAGPLFSPTEHNGSVNSVAFSPDGNRLASGSDDRSIIVWDVSYTNDKLPLTKSTTLSGHSDWVSSIAFSPDGVHLASGSSNTNDSIIISDCCPTTSNDHSVILWDLKDTNRPTQIATTAKGKGVSSLDGKIEASIGNDNNILWNINSPDTPSFFSSPSGDEWTVLAISPDRNIIAASNLDNEVVLWDNNEPNAFIQLSTLSRSTDLTLNTTLFGKGVVLTFSADGKFIATNNTDVTIALWDISNSKDPVITAILSGLRPSSYNESSSSGFINSLTTLAFSPDGKTFAAGSNDSVIVLWNINDPQNPFQRASLSGHTKGINGLTFSPDGKYLASGSEDKTTILWDVSGAGTSSQLAILAKRTFENDQEEYGGRISNVAFSPDGMTLASVSDGTITLWNINPQSLVDKTCQRVRRNFTYAEWTQYFPNAKYEKTCEQWPLEPEITSTP